MSQKQEPQAQIKERVPGLSSLTGHAAQSPGTEQEFILASPAVGNQSLKYVILAVFAVLIALLIRWPLWPIWGTDFPYITFFPVVMLMAYRGGLLPGLLATTLSAVAAWTLFLIQPGPPTTLFPNVSAMALFILVGVIVSWLSEAQRRAVAWAKGEAVTARIAEMRLRCEEQQFRQLAELLPQFIWTTRPDGYCDYLSKQWCDYTGVSEEPQLGSGWLEAVHPDDRKRLAENWQVVVAKEVAFDIDFRIRSGTNEYRWFKTRAVPVRDSERRITRWVGSNTDIEDVKCAEAAARRFSDELEARVAERTEELSQSVAALRREVTERQKAEENLASVSRQLQGVMAAATEVSIIATDANGLITVFNSGAERLLGYSAEEMIGKQTPQLIHIAEEVAEHGRVLEDELGVCVAGFDVFVARAKQGGHDEREWTYVRKDGSRLTVSLVVTALRNECGEPSGYLGVAVDISKRKFAEEELRRAKQSAEAANKAKSEFLATMSHEIRTPMNGILGMTSLALDTDLTPLQQEFLSTVKSSADSLLTVINDILDYSKIEAGKLELDPQPFTLRDAIGDVLKPLAYRAQSKELELVCRIDPATPEALVGDMGRLRQVLVNLIGNALKFTDRGEVVVQVEAEDQGADGRVLHFSVSDTGIGIPSSKLTSIFEPFTQADASTTRTYGGTGLGLTISSELVELMGGKIWAVSEPGVGSTFHFTARFESQSAPTDALFRLPLSQVIVATANNSSRAVLSELLTSWGARVQQVASLAQVIANVEVATTPIAAILLDTSVPDINSKKLRLRLSGLCGRVSAIVLLTGDPEFGKTCREDLGRGLILSKPPKQSELFDALRETYGNLEARPQSVSASRKISKSRNSLRVLLAEDNPVNARLATLLVEKQGHIVTTVGTGRAAVEALEHGSFDVVLMDMQLPEMDGLDATAAIRQREQSSGEHVQIIALTANAMKGDRERCLEVGMDDYLSKPLMPQELFDALERVPTESHRVFHSNSESVFSVADALATLDGDVDDLHDLIEIFMETAPAELAFAGSNGSAISPEAAVGTAGGGNSIGG